MDLTFGRIRERAQTALGWCREQAREGRADFGAMLRSAAGRRVLWLCVPALVLGLGLRITLMSRMPYAFISEDTRTIMGTVEKFVQKGEFEMATKKVFLSPFLYSLPVFFRQPALPWIAVGQHALGLLVVVLVGILCALWFRHWMAWIVPLTLYAGLNLDFLWFEHLALPESLFLCFSMAAAVCGTLYFRRPTPARFALFWLALYLTAGSRPEGKLFCGFGIVLAALAPAVGWKPRLRRGAVALLLTAWIFSITRTGQSGLLLFTSVVNFSPERFATVPGFEEEVRPIRERTAVEWRVRPTDMVRVRRELSRAAEAYCEKQGIDLSDSRKDAVNDICKRAGMETVLRSPLRALRMASRKFLYTLNAPPASTFGPVWIYDEHMDIFFEPDGARKGSAEYLDSLTGRDFATPAELREWLQRMYRPFDPDWLTGARDAIHGAAIRIRLPDGEREVLGLPLLHLAALAGVVLLVAASRGMRWMHLAWAGTVFGLLAIVFVTANIKSRFRFAFEPWWVIYAFALLDAAVTAAVGLWAMARRGRSTT